MEIKEKLSIVIPLFNEEHNIQQLYNALTSVLLHMTDQYEIIFVDDGSSDRSFEIIRELHQANNKVNGLSLSRNFGHQVALLAGLEHTTGELVITMDADLQHPPELIPQLYTAFREGFDIVNTRRTGYTGESLFKKCTSRLFYKILNVLSDIKIEPESADFRLMTRKAVDAFLKFNERDRFNRGLISWIGFKQTVIDYQASQRFSGKTKYTFRKMLSFGLDGIASFSSKPLRISFYFGLFVFLLGILYAIYAIVQNILGKTVPGWTSILVTLLIIGGVMLLSLGIIGEYIARIFNEVKSRPHYFIKDKI